MRTYQNPAPETWPSLLARPVADAQQLEGTVQAVLQAVQQQGDAAVLHYTQQFDGVVQRSLRVPAEACTQAAHLLPDELRAAIQQAAANIRHFHAAQLQQEQRVETMPGVQCWRRSVPIQRVGLYIPGGTAPLFSTVLMLGIPAQLAACPVRVLCTPPDKHGNIHPAILYCAQLVGITDIFAIGGVQAIAAMGYGTASVPQVDKLFGPGNQYVTAAKRMLASAGMAIDMPAGPSEVLVLADDSAVPAFVAADLLSQAEHGADSQVMLVSTSAALVQATQAELQTQLAKLPRRALAEQALVHSKAVVLPTLEACIAFANDYAAEHLIIAMHDATIVAEQINAAGSVFLGHYTPESLGDYASGTNHTLPTNGFARAWSGVSVDSFVKKITYQQVSQEGLLALGPVVEQMAAAEQLVAHQQAVSIRLQAIRSSTTHAI